MPKPTKHTPHAGNAGQAGHPRPTGTKHLFIPKVLPRPHKDAKRPTKRMLHAQNKGPAPDRTNPGNQSNGSRLYDPEKHCGAQLRNKERGRLCRQMKGHKTPHLGEGRCWLHGGLTPIKHGLSSLVKHGRLKDLIRKMNEIDHDMMDLTPEIQLLRAMTIDFVNRYDEFTDQLETWYNALDESRKANDLPPVPRKFPSLEDAGPLLEAISRMIERVHKITREGSITMDVFRGLMTQMGMVVAGQVTDSGMLQRIEDGWTALVVNPKSFVKTTAGTEQYEGEA